MRLGHPTLQLLLRTLALFAFLLFIWPAPPTQAAEAPPSRCSRGAATTGSG